MFKSFLTCVFLFIVLGSVILEEKVFISARIPHGWNDGSDSGLFPLLVDSIHDDSSNNFLADI